MLPSGNQSFPAQMLLLVKSVHKKFEEEREEEGMQIKRREREEEGMQIKRRERGRGNADKKKKKGEKNGSR